MEKEIRCYVAELRKQPDSRRIEGRAIPFNVFSPNREGFREQVLPEAVEGVIEQSDIFLRYNHQIDQFLARSNEGRGSLQIEVKDDGVWFSFEAGSDNLSNYIVERMERGELNETSWAFTVEKDTWEKQADGTYNRTITKFRKLYDFSIVDQSYYGIQDVVKCRSFEEFKEQEARELEEAKEAEIKANHEALVEKYKDLMLEKSADK